MNALSQNRSRNRTARLLHSTSERRLLATRAVSDQDAPLYRRVIQVVKEEILAGRYPVGTQLPTESELCKRFDVSRHTVREALRQLREDGLVTSRQGSGTTVRALASLQPYVHETASLEDLVAHAMETQYRPDASSIVVANAALAERLDGSAGRRWLRIEGYRYGLSSHVPVCWTEVFVDEAYAGVGRLLGRRPGPIYGWIEEQYGERITEMEQSLRVGTVPQEIASTLQVKQQSTVVEVRRIFHVALGKVAEVSFNLYPAERFSFSMTLRRAAR